MLISEITDDALINKMVDSFFEAVDHIIVNENHIYKYRGSREVCRLLNKISWDLGLSLLFYDDGLGVYMRSEKIGREVLALGSVLREFRRRYRSGQICCG